MAVASGHHEELGSSLPIPDKLYFKIGEVARLVGVQAHVLRYWQSEIAAIRPSKSVSNQRRYRHRDVEVFREVRRLLYDEGYTLAGARRRIMSRDSGAGAGGMEARVDAAASSGPVGRNAGFEPGVATAINATSFGSAPGAHAAAAAATTAVASAEDAVVALGGGAPADAGPDASDADMADAASTVGGHGTSAKVSGSNHASSARSAHWTVVPSRAAAAPVPATESRVSGLDEDLLLRLRRGLQDLIRLAGEEP